MYLVGFVGGWWLAVRQAKRPNSAEAGGNLRPAVQHHSRRDPRRAARLCAVLQSAALPDHPLEIFYLWTGGCRSTADSSASSLAMWYFGRKTQRAFFTVADFIAPVTPLGPRRRTPRQFHQPGTVGQRDDRALGHGVQNRRAAPAPSVAALRACPRRRGAVSDSLAVRGANRAQPRRCPALFLVCYGVFRFLVEFVREPDVQLGYLAFGWVTMGQILSLPMILFGGLAGCGGPTGRAHV